MRGGRGVDGQPTGLLERLRAQRESMQYGATAPAAQPGEGVAEPDQVSPIPFPPAIVEPAHSSPHHPIDSYQLERIDRLEIDRDDLRHRLDSVEANLRSGL